MLYNIFFLLSSFLFFLATDPNERLVQFADWLVKRTEELMERSARARQKTYELLRLARNRQKDPMEY